MKNIDKYLSVTRGPYILSETDILNRLNFFRKDGRCLEEGVEEIASALYQLYIIKRMLTSEHYPIIISETEFAFSADRKHITITAKEEAIEFEPHSQGGTKKKHLFRRLFGKKDK
jgi:hypothetical protein